MADAYNIRIGGYLDAQGTTTAMRGSRHDSLPDPGVARLQETAVRATAYVAGGRACRWCSIPDGCS
jgi:hypothetical protein